LAAPEFGTRTKVFCRDDGDPVNQQAILTEAANNAPAAQVNNDLTEGMLFKARRKSEEVGVLRFCWAAKATWIIHC
jgi:hypothetical protein